MGVSGSAADRVDGGSGNDNLEGIGRNGGPDVVLGGLGNDFIHDAFGEDLHRGGPGADTVGFESPRLDQRDLTLGGTGADCVWVQDGFGGDEARGGPGRDWWQADAGDRVVSVEVRGCPR